MPKRINLVPPADRVRTVTNFGVLILLAASILVVFALGLSYFLLTTTRSGLQDDLTFLQQERGRLEKEVAALASYKALATQRSNLESVVQSVYAGRTPVSRVLDDLSLVMPDNVWLSSLSLSTMDPAGAFADPTVVAAGTVDRQSAFSMDGSTYSFPDVALLLVRLQLVEALQAITLKQAGESQQGNVDPAKKVRSFSISGILVNTQEPDLMLPVSKVEVEGL